MVDFKLQSVLDHRQMVEDTRKKELADIKQQRSKAWQQLDALERKEMDTVGALKHEQVQGLASDQVVAYQAYLQRLALRIAEQRRVIANIEAREAHKHAELLDAMKNRRILEKLREQQRDRCNRASLKKEMEFIDEVAVNQFARKTTTGTGGGE